MKPKLKNFHGISIDYLLALLIAILVITTIARARSNAESEPVTGLRLLEECEDMLP
ncbi:hypothetical protein OKA04_09995 [Luteolibacter flavescens]|uniref:Uncharacterized protein n=1 Tax=Luteolibacter flavescens TaxID=1859460 RepID=A0ABT3FNB3_9BACT|nr:hypothetical protein [Luteolibacter flavescens]MCW1885058.1 hypothetical protein [Luteolibacter flavescens]